PGGRCEPFTASRRLPERGQPGHLPDERFHPAMGASAPMKYSRVLLNAIGYELPPVVVTTGELEQRLRPALESLRIPEGQLEALTGIVERRWWDARFSLADGAVAAGRRALATAGIQATDLDVVIYAGVCREQFEPATACRVAAGLQVGPQAAVYDLSNACLGVLNGMVDIANRIEL